MNALPARRVFLPAAVMFMASALLAETPKLNIRTAHGYPLEEQRKEQMERLAKQYDLVKYTITRDIVIERGAMNHSTPVLTLNLRFLDNDDLALSAYVHEQGHWLLLERFRAENPALLDDLEQTFPGLEYRQPQGDGDLRSSYYHIAVCMLEWQAMEELTGERRARKVIDWKQQDHYTAIYKILLQQRAQVEAVLNRHAVKW
ncbi:MAG TPA: hypothetical protein VKF79_00560 [Candidatus Acidoferrum sp.]|nr:hypothetical protein [Candidatus Acidoferrum sp.]